MNRRQVLAKGSVAIAVAANGASAFGRGPSDVDGRQDTVARFAVVDPRCDRDERFATGARGARREVLLAEGDVTDVWFHRLEPVWRNATEAVEGLTTATAAFCLAELARDCGMRMRRTAAIGRTEDGSSIVHWLIAPVRGAA